MVLKHHGFSLIYKHIRGKVWKTMEVVFKGGTRMIPSKSLRFHALALTIALIAGCASAQTQQVEAGPPPPQNLIGSTDELQLVTELSLNLGKEYGGENVLVVLAIDNTLFSVPENTDPCDFGELPLVQADAAQQVRRMQESGLKVIALTGREPACREQTLRELQRNGIDFSASAWPPLQGFPENFIPGGGFAPVSYRQGVFLAAGQDKGLMLKTLLQKSGSAQPVLIVMADHEQGNLNAVMKTFSFTSTKVHAWRYSRETTPVLAQEPRAIADPESDKL